MESELLAQTANKLISFSEKLKAMKGIPAAAREVSQCKKPPERRAAMDYLITLYRIADMDSTLMEAELAKFPEPDAPPPNRQETLAQCRHNWHTLAERGIPLNHAKDPAHLAVPNLHLTTEQLKEATGCCRLSDLETTLRKNGVRFLYGKNGRIFTTLQAVNAAMGLSLQTGVKSEIEIDIL